MVFGSIASQSSGSSIVILCTRRRIVIYPVSVLNEMLSVSAMEASYRQHVMQRVFLKTLPDFSALLDLKEDQPWPSLDEAHRRFSALRHSLDDKTPLNTYLSFCEMLLADQFSYKIAFQIEKARKALQQKDSASLTLLWKLKQMLLDLPTLLTQMPELMLQALQSVQKPTKPDTWGLILLSKQHRIPCAVCKSHVTADDSIRVRCLCCPFGYLAHRGCVEEKRCLICSSAFHVSKLKAH